MGLQNKALGFIGLGSMGGGLVAGEGGVRCGGARPASEAVQRFVEHGGGQERAARPWSIPARGADLRGGKGRDPVGGRGAAVPRAGGPDVH